MTAKIIKLTDRIKALLAAKRHGFYSHEEQAAYKRGLERSRSHLNHYLPRAG